MKTTIKLQHLTLTASAVLASTLTHASSTDEFVVYQKGSGVRLEKLGLKKIRNLSPNGKIFAAVRTSGSFSVVGENKDFIVEPNYIFHKIQPVAEESKTKAMEELFSLQWNLKNIGQTDAAGQTGTPGADIFYESLVDLPAPIDKALKISVIDSGIEGMHPDLGTLTLTAKTFVDGESQEDALKDDLGHGTHVTGIIGANAHNSLGIAGIVTAPHIHSVKVFGSSGSTTLMKVIQGIEEAEKSGAKVINLSLGGPEKSEILEEVMRNAKNVTFVTAAGNEGSDLEQFPVYPAAYKLPNQIVVAATDNQDQLALFSNYNATQVDIGAPGQQIMSTFKNAKFRAFSGTSMATPHVTAAVALLLQREPGLEPLQVKQRIVDSGTALDSLRGKTSQGTRLNLKNLLGL